EARFVSGRRTIRSDIDALVEPLRHQHLEYEGVCRIGRQRLNRPSADVDGSRWRRRGLAERLAVRADEIAEATGVPPQGVEGKGGQTWIGHRYSRRVKAPCEAAQLLHLLHCEHG